MPRTSRPEASRYHPITRFLQGQDGDVVEVDFAFIERLIGGKLPSSATRYHQWWANNMSKHSQAKSWMLAGWRGGGQLEGGHGLLHARSVAARRGERAAARIKRPPRKRRMGAGETMTQRGAAGTPIPRRTEIGKRWAVAAAVGHPAGRAGRRAPRPRRALRAPGGGDRGGLARGGRRRARRGLVRIRAAAGVPGDGDPGRLRGRGRGGGRAQVARLHDARRGGGCEAPLDRPARRAAAHDDRHARDRSRLVAARRNAAAACQFDG